MDVRPLHNKDDYKVALARASELVDLDPEQATPEGDELELLSIIIERYEAENFPIEKPDPIEAIRFRMEQAGMTVDDMRPYIGSPNRVYEVLNGKRQLSLGMIRRLHEGLKIPADVLIGSAA